MAPRRWHKKSFTGCRTCKLRKVKCDETRPICSNCVRHNASCDYAPLPSRDSSAQRLSPESRLPLSSRISPCPPGLGAAPTENFSILDLRLFHHYLTSTSLLLPFAQGTWSVSVPQLAFQHDYVLHSLMAIAAFHLHQLKVEDPALKAATHRHMGNAISKYRNAIPRLNQNSIDPVWVTGVMITLLSRLRHFSSKDIYTLPVELFRMTRGLRNVMLASRQWIPSSTMMIFLRGNAMGKLEELVRNEKTAQKTRKKFSALLNGLGAGEEGSEKEEVYVTALSCIDLICEEYERNGSAESIRRQLSGTAAFIPSEFANFLENQEPLAMAILAYYFAMMKFVEGVWWLQGVPEYEIRGIESLMPRECLWAIEWPLQVINAKDPLSLDSRQWPQPSTGHIFYESAGITDLMGSFDDKLGLPSSSVNPLLGTFAIDEESDPNLWLDLDS